MKREKDKLIQISIKRLSTKNTKKPSRMMISIFLSFSLHFLIIVLISLILQNSKEIINIEKANIKPVEIQIAANLFAIQSSSSTIDNGKKKIGLEQNNFFHNIKEKQEIMKNEVLNRQNIDEKHNEEDRKNISNPEPNENQNPQVYSSSSSGQSSDISLNTSSESSQNISKQISQNFFQNNEGDNSNIVNKFSNENIFQYSINISSLFKYPKDALKLGIQGTVKLKLQIDKYGKVINVILFESSGSKLLDNYTVKQASQLLFSFPEDNKPDSSFWIIIKVVYSIKTNVSVEAAG